ncbi:DUF3533 domain-containing protein [Stackebrandtia soli]|uniref:DUF3533 domain-containing protein n=1 Tax=Stackebrandtia soli TaxID=1892856 RepID=UPI0039E95840
MTATDTEKPVNDSLMADVRDAIAGRAFWLVAGVLLLQFAFILSYVGAFHDPGLHRVSMDVVAPGDAGPRLVQQLNAMTGEPIDAEVVADAETARENVESGFTRSALIVDPTSTTDVLYVAGGAGASLTTAIQELMTAVEQRQNRQLTVVDVAPVQDGDARGLTAFYLVVGWIVGGYLAAAVLGVSRGSRAATRQRAVIRLAAMVPYAIVSGLLGAVIVDPVLGALTGRFAEIAGIGALLVFCAAAVTMALQVLFGLVGVGVTLIVFVIWGNPSAGGAFATEMLPTFWRETGPWLPSGAGVSAIRDVVYFDSNGLDRPLLTIAVWAIAGMLIMLVGSSLLHRRGRLSGFDGGPAPIEEPRPNDA